MQYDGPGKYNSHLPSLRSVQIFFLYFICVVLLAFAQAMFACCVLAEISILVLHGQLLPQGKQQAVFLSICCEHAYRDIHQLPLH